MWIRRSIELLALIIGVGVAAYLYQSSGHTDSSSLASDEFRVMLESRNHGHPEKSVGVVPDQGSEKITTTSAGGIARYQTPQTAVEAEIPEEAANLRKDIGDTLSPEDPIFADSSQVTNIGDWIDPDDVSTWMPMEQEPTRNIGENIDPDRAY